MSHCSAFPNLRSLFLWLVTSLAAAVPLHAATITVGNGGCQYIGLQFALDALESQPGPHVIKLRTQTIAIPNGLVLDTHDTDYTFIGGHASCADAQPTPGQVTVLDASGGDDGTAFAVNGHSSSHTPEVAIHGVVIRGGNAETGPFANPEGGGMEIRGRIFVLLDGGTSIEENASGKGGGVYLRGDNANERVTVQLLGDSFIGFNQASASGGGIHCEDHGLIYLDRGQVSGNTSADDGGGIALYNQCGLDALVQAPGFAGLVGNEAGDGGGGIYMQGRATIALRGASSMPFWVSGNAARWGAGAVLWNPDSTRVTANFRSVVIIDNHAELNGGALSVESNVDLVIAPAVSATTCSYLGVGHGACSAIVGNGHGASNNLSSVVSLYSPSDPTRAPTLTMQRTLLSGNEGHNLIGAPLENAGIAVDIVNSVIVGNTLRPPFSTTPSALVHLGTDDADTDLRIRHTTMTGNSVAGGTGHMLHYGFRPVDLTGALMYNPGLLLRTQFSDPIVSHGGCLLSHEAGSIAPIVADPELDAGLMPGPTSPALDRCSPTGAPSVDFHGRPRSVDQPGIPDPWGRVDIGALERPADSDVIFADGFQ